ncbi:MAG TPA: hypothetical protein VIR55_14270 [Ignavibacteria bacterium]
MKKNLLIFLILSLNIVYAQQIFKKEYLERAKIAVQNEWKNRDQIIENYKKNIDTNYVFGYNPPAGDIYLAALHAHFYKEEGKKEDFEKAKQLLVGYGEYKKAYPPDYYKKKSEYAKGLPALPNIFTGAAYCRAYILIKDEPGWTKKEKEIVEKNIAESADYIMNFQEWGAMNRAMLRAEFLASCIKALPNHPNVNKWKTLCKSIADDNIAKWEIEDATGYHAIWLYALLNYADYSDNYEFLYSPVMNYYYQYFSYLFAPDKTMPEFGDADYNAAWVRYLPFFEKAASITKDSHIKWVATEYFKKNVLPIEYSKINSSLGLFFYDCYRWCDDNIKPEPSKKLSMEVLEDVVGKKIVFRDGWNDKSTYLLLNYRDEGDGGLLDRDNLRNSIPVEEEKMTHGHSDENGICQLQYNGSFLLYESGYRDFMPSGPYGAYRADYFHNRVCIRREKIFKGQSEGGYRYANGGKPVIGQTMLEFYHNSGAYRKVVTNKIDFLTFDEFDMSRTRVTDPKMKYQQDRVITWIKELNIFVVFDIVKFLEEDYFTAANLWHTRKILDRGNGWYETQYDSIRTLPVNTNNALLIYFPENNQKMEGFEKEKRCYQDEFVIYQMDSRHVKMGDMISFITILIPHPKDKDVKNLMSNIKVINSSDPNNSIGVTINYNGKKFYVYSKMDFDKELSRDHRRPKYTYESGKVNVEEFETDGHYLFGILDGKKLNYCITNVIKAQFKNKLLFEQAPSTSGLAFDNSPDGPGTMKLRYWKESVEIK